MSKSWKARLATPALALVILAALALLMLWSAPDPSQRWSLGDAATWLRLASPGSLSQAHAAFERDCAACHTSVAGAEAVKCILCHADNRDLLGRQPTAFHADIGTCTPCHLEHRGRARRPTDMDHAALARFGLRGLAASGGTDSESRTIARQLQTWIAIAGQPRPLTSGQRPPAPEELVLDCASCHKNDDRHFDLFGRDCVQCHQTTKWTIPSFRHPRESSRDCAQCHQAPPSHYMGHFQMISRRIPAKPNARVDQCYLCHQTTSWPDIKGVGWYKHH